MKRATQVSIYIVTLYAISIHALMKRATQDGIFHFPKFVFQSTPS